MNSLKRFIIFSLLIPLCGCASQFQFIPTSNVPTKAKDEYARIDVFDSEKDVPWPYQKIGEIFPERQPRSFQDPEDQILSIEDVALANGADAIILNHDSEVRGGGFSNQQFGYAIQRSVMVFSATAIIKKEAH